MIDAHDVTASIPALGITLDVSDFELTLDENAAPYAEARLRCAMPSSVDRAAIDMRAADIQVQITLRRDYGSPTRITDLTALFTGDVSDITAYVAGRNIGTAITNHFYRPWNGPTVRGSDTLTADMYMVERSFDDVALELTITAQSDEARLINDALLVTTPWDPGTTSLRSICRQVIARYGAVLEDGVTDSTVAEADATIWKPGVTAWKYLDPMLETAGLRLWCDELGLWRLSQRQSTTEGSVSISTANTLTSNRDTMTLDPEVWYDGVAVEYRWVDDLGVSHVEYDVAGPQPAKSVRRLEKRDVVYPGPGAAAGILSRGAGRGRVLDVQAVSDYTIRPGMSATIAPPDTVAQTGYVSSITWRVPEAEMTLATRGLVDTPPTAWLFGTDATEWADVPVGMKWNAFDWSLV